jgi:hypothetical protein
MALLPLTPLRTVLASFPAHGSSLPKVRFGPGNDRSATRKPAFPSKPSPCAEGNGRRLGRRMGYKCPLDRARLRVIFIDQPRWERSAESETPSPDVILH